MNYYVYILSNAHKNVIYTGVTNDLIRRVYEHKQHLDKGSFTARYNVENLVYYEVTTNPEAAIAREKQIKGWNRKRKDNMISEKNPKWVDLYETLL
ncbi:MAG: GIY-YIG nuclease family protein [Oscillospiraceae bacterium]|nr:GIY-YIG nuclease family protein [Oscillospiraceae bacterium]